MVAYCLAVLFTFPLQNFPSLEVLTAACAAKDAAGGPAVARRNAVALLVVVAMGLVSRATMHNLDKVVSLSGSMIGIPLTFVMPPLIQMKLDGDLKGWRKGVNYCVVALGVGAMVVCTSSVIKEW